MAINLTTIKFTIMRIYDIYKNVGDLTTFWKTAKKHGHDKRYPYAINMIARYIFGDKDTWNMYYAISRGDGGTGHSCCFEDGGYECNCIMLDYEYSWRENLRDLNESIAHLPLKNGELVKDRY